MAANEFKFEDVQVKAAAAELATGNCSLLKAYFDAAGSLNSQSSLLDAVKAAHDGMRKESSKFLEPLTIDKGTHEGGNWSNDSVYLRVRNQHKDLFDAKYDVKGNSTASECHSEKK